jgi:hypothetical protein
VIAIKPNQKNLNLFIVSLFHDLNWKMMIYLNNLNDIYLFNHLVMVLIQNDVKNLNFKEDLRDCLIKLYAYYHWIAQFT